MKPQLTSAFALFAMALTGCESMSAGQPDPTPHAGQGMDSGAGTCKYGHEQALAQAGQRVCEAVVE